MSPKVYDIRTVDTFNFVCVFNFFFLKLRYYIHKTIAALYLEVYYLHFVPLPICWVFRSQSVQDPLFPYKHYYKNFQDQILNYFVEFAKIKKYKSDALDQPFLFVLRIYIILNVKKIWLFLLI